MSNDIREPLPDFENPPLIEVVCGVQFPALDDLLAPHLGLFWERVREDFPLCSEKPPLPPAIERPEGTDGGLLQLTTTPPLPRTWFRQSPERGIIQTQRDRFLFNWKKVDSEDAYPRHKWVLGQFRGYFDSFKAVLGEQGLQAPQVNQCELTYVNQIRPDADLLISRGIGGVFPDFDWRKQDARFLPSVETMFWRSSFVLPKQQGRLHTTIRGLAAKPGETQEFQLEMTARGLPAAETSAGDVWGWFEMAREWIVRGFTDLTSDAMHRKWGRKS